MVVELVEVVTDWAVAVAPTEINAIRAMKETRACIVGRAILRGSGIRVICSILLPIRVQLTTSCSLLAYNKNG